MANNRVRWIETVRRKRREQKDSLHYISISLPAILPATQPPSHHATPAFGAELGKLANTASHVNVGIIVIGIEELCLVCPGS